MKLKFFFLLLIIFCESPLIAQNNTSVDDIKSKLVGSWSWTITEICQRSNPPQETPLSCSCQKKLVINSKDRVTLFTNDVIEGTSEFTVDEIQETNDSSIFIFRSEVILGYVKVDENSLSISTCGTDGNNYKYVKIKN